MTTTEDKKAAVVAEDKTKPEKSKTALEEDDEFEDFPADEGWKNDTGVQPLNAWEDTWEDDDDSNDFSVLLSEERKKKTSGVTPMKA